jgi:hypothetical protein
MMTGIGISKHLQHQDKPEQSFQSMATIHSQRKCLHKLACSALVASLLCAAMVITRAYPHSDLINKLLPSETNNQTNTTMDTPGQNQEPMPNWSTAMTNLEAIQRNSQSLGLQLEQALAKIERNVQKNKDLTSWFSRSPKAIKTIQALEAATDIFGQTKPNPEYEIAKYATGNRRWKHAPAQHPVPIQDLLLYNIHIKHDQNKILGDKIAEVVRQNIHLAQQSSSAYETPSKKLKKDPFMGLVTKTVATYMFLRHNNGQKRNNNNPEMEDFWSWGEPFFKKKEWKQQ